MTWTTIPPWLYQNDLPDEQLQAVYVQGLRAKVAQIRDELAQAEEMLADAEEALARYRPHAAVRPSSKVLPKPKR
jgi:hypothetical protein